MTSTRSLLPDLTRLQAFECAARHGSITQAGRELNLTQSAVSRQIRDLEAQLGVSLFERIRQRVVLSGAGRKFLADARRLLEQGEAAMLRAMTGSRTTLFSLATLPTFGSRWLVPRLPAYLEAHPDMALNLVSRSEPFDLDEQGVDAAIHYGQPVWANALCREICREVMVPVASPALLETIGPNLAGMPQAPLLHLATRPKAWATWFQSAGLATEPAYRGHRFDQFAMLIEAAIAGIGAALLPRYLIEPELAVRDLLVIADMPLATDNGYYFVVPLANKEHEVSGRFFEWIVGEVGRAK